MTIQVTESEGKTIRKCLDLLKDGGEGRNMLRRTRISLETIVMRSAIGAFPGTETYTLFIQGMWGYDEMAMHEEVK